MLNDDVTVVDDFEAKLEAHLAHFSEPMKFATFRLGQFDLGLVVSRESAAASKSPSRRDGGPIYAALD